jgi:hypothetical protein
LPWWRAGLPLAVWAAYSCAFALIAALAAVTVQRAWRGAQARSPLLAAGMIGLVSALIVAADPFTGGILTRDPPLASQTLAAARMYGFVNTVFAVLLTGAILATVLFAGGAWARAKRLAAAVPIALIGLAILVIDASPDLGADFGGAIGIAAGFVVMALAAADVRVNWKWIAAALLAGAAAAGAMAWLDYRRGPDQWTHLGGLVDLAINGGFGEVAVRKGLMWARLSAGPAIALAIGGLVCFWLAKRGAFNVLKAKAWVRAPLRKPLLIGLVTAWIVSSLVNDSGLTIAVTGLMMAGPALVAGLVQVNRRQYP